MPANAVYVGRPTKWGNPFDWRYWVRAAGWQEKAARQFVAEQFARCLLSRDEPEDPDKAEAIDRIRRDIEELAGKDLVCWCPLDSFCHADALLRLAAVAAHERQQGLTHDG